MNKFIKVVLIIAAVFAGVGVLCCGVAAVAGASVLDVKSKMEAEDITGLEGKDITGLKGKDITGLGNHTNVFGRIADWVEDAADTVSIRSNDYDGSWIHGSNVIRDEYSYTQDQIRDLDISLYTGSLTLEESDTADARVVIYHKNALVSCEMNGETLEIRDEKKSQVKKHHVAVTLYLPENIELRTLSIDAGAGKVESNLQQLVVKQAEVTVDAGEAVFDALKVQDALTASVQAGSIEFADTYTKELSLDCGVGELIYQGGTTGDVTGSSGVGSLELDLDGKQSAYNYSLTCGVGSIDIGDESYSGLGTEKDIDHDAEKNMTLDCGVGSIDVDFD